MEINYEALKSLSFSDLITLRNYSGEKKDWWFKNKGPEASKPYAQMQAACVIEIDNRVKNIFIF